MEKHIGQALKSRRDAKGWSQGQLAYKSGVERATISLIESGQTDSPKLDTILHLALALDTTVDSLLIDCGLLPPPDTDTIWHPELLVMQRVLDAVAEIDPQLRADLSRIVLGQAEGWRQLTELAKSSDIPEQDEGTNETL